MIDGNTKTFNISGRQFKFHIELDHDYDPNLELLVSCQLGIPDAAIVHLIAKVVRPGDTVIDGGANIGYFSLLLSQAVGSTGNVSAIEPDQKNSSRLNRNLFTNHCMNVGVVEKALWHSDGLITLHVSANGGVNSLVAHNDTTATALVDATTIRPFLPCRFMKLDIEGAEYDVLSAIKSPDECPYIVTELNEVALGRFNHNQMKLRKLMWDKGYSTFLLSNTGDMPILVPPNTRLACTRANTNVLFSTLELVGQVWSLIAV